MWRASGNKFGNVQTTFNGRVFDSKREAGHAAILESMKRAKEPHQRVKSILYQYPIPIVVNNTKIGKYIADFYVSFEDGHKEVHEVKGMKTAVYKLKKRLVEAIYGYKILEF